MGRGEIGGAESAVGEAERGKVGVFEKDLNISFSNYYIEYKTEGELKCHLTQLFDKQHSDQIVRLVFTLSSALCVTDGSAGGILALMTPFLDVCDQT